jgi:TolA-binding protein
MSPATPLIRKLGLVLLVGALAAGPARAGDDAGRDTVAGIGLAFEAASALPEADRATALADLRGRIVSLLDDGVDDDRRTGARLLAAEIAYAMGDFERAAEWFEKARDDADETPYADDASAGRIRSLEAMGKDAEAAKLWQEWYERYGDGALAAEIQVARVWNCIRRDSLSDAREILADAVADAPWLGDDPRVILATSTLAYLDGHPEAVIAAPSGSPVDDAAIYLSALVLEGEGNPLKAAARYQELIERYPDSRLRDRAMLAKANVFLDSNAYRSAAEEFALVAERASDPAVVAEARMRHAAAVFLDGDVEGGAAALRDVATTYHGSDIGARAQMMLAEAMLDLENYEAAIVEFNKVLTTYFQHELAASAQYRVGRCLDALDRHAEATSAYQAVVAGYTTSREAPAAAYLAGAGLLAQDRPDAAAPYFQIVLDRYANDPGEGTIEFATAERRELVEASLCLLQLSYHRLGNLGMLSGRPHQMLLRMPPSDSKWRAYALLIDADALAAQGRYDEAQGSLETLTTQFDDATIAVPASRLLAWTYAQQGESDLAARTEEHMLARYGAAAAREDLGSAYLNRAHLMFNKKHYDQAAAAYEEYLSRFPDDAQRQLGLYQAGLCYLRLGRDGDAVDRWEALVSIDPSAPIAEKAWTRAGDVYFRAEHYDDARRCYQGLVDNFADSRAIAVGLLRIAQSQYNAGNDAEAVEAFSEVMARFPGHPAAEDASKGIERALYRLGKGEDGETILAELVEKYPTSSFAADAQFEIAMRRYGDEDYAAAAEEFRRVISQFPSYSAGDRAHYLMADSYSRAGATDDARLAYEQFLRFFPDSEYQSEVRLRLGADRFASGDYMRAAVEFTSVLGDSTSPEVEAAALYNLALCKKMLGKNEEAMTALERYREDYPDDEREADICLQIGDLHERAGRDADAETWYKRGLMAPTNTKQTIELCYRLGMARERQGNPDGALKAYAGALKQDDKSDPYRLSAVARCAALHEKNKNYRKAIVAYRDLIKNASDPEIVVAAKERASELESLGH